MRWNIRNLTVLDFKGSTFFAWPNRICSSVPDSFIAVMWWTCGCICRIGHRTLPLFRISAPALLRYRCWQWSHVLAVFWCSSWCERTVLSAWRNDSPATATRDRSNSPTARDWWRGQVSFDRLMSVFILIYSTVMLSCGNIFELKCRMMMMMMAMVMISCSESNKPFRRFLVHRMPKFAFSCLTDIVCWPKVEMYSQRRRAIAALEARVPPRRCLQNRVQSITLCVTLNFGKIVFVTLCIQIEWLFYKAFWCETVTQKWRWLHPGHGGTYRTCPHCYKWLGTEVARVRRTKKTRKWSNCTDHTEALTKTTDCTCKAKKWRAQQKFSGASRLTCASHF